MDAVRLVELEIRISALLSQNVTMTPGELTGAILQYLETTRPEVIQALQRLEARGEVRSPYDNHWAKITR